MNELSELFASVRDGETVTLEAGGTYHVREEDCYRLTGYYCSNTCLHDENPDGRRSAAVFLKGKRGVTIEGNGAAILIHGKITPFVFDSCENITVKDLSVDYACPTMAEFTVLASGDGRCVLRVSRDTLFRVEGNRIYWRGENGPGGTPYWEHAADGPKQFVTIYDPSTEKSRLTSPAVLAFSSVEADGRDLTVSTDNCGEFVPGTVFQSRNIVRDQTGGMFQRCRDLRFEGLRIKFMHGLGMVSQFCENVSYINCDLTPGEGRTIASTADFFHFSGCRGLVEIIGCRARGAHDDFANVHGTHLRVTETGTDGRSLTVRFMHGESWGFQAFEKGDSVEFIRWDTLIPYAEAKVTSYERLSDTDIRLTLDRRIPEGVETGKDVLENASWTPDVHISGCDIGPIAARGILCTTRGRVLIENNRFRRLKFPALLVEDDCNFWFESGYTKHIVFRNNEVSGCSYDGAYAGHPALRYSPQVMDKNSREYVHGRLTVENCRFRDAEGGTHLFDLSYLARAEITGCEFDADYMIGAKTCGAITDEGNTVK